MKTFEVQKTLQVRCYLQKNIKEIHKNGWHHKIHYFSELFEFRRKIQPKCFTKTPGQNNVFSHYFFGVIWSHFLKDSWTLKSYRIGRSRRMNKPFSEMKQACSEIVNTSSSDIWKWPHLLAGALAGGLSARQPAKKCCSTGLENFIFLKFTISAFECRVAHNLTTSR